MSSPDPTRSPGDPVPSADEITGLLGLTPLSHEGGRYTQTLSDEHGTAIYYLLGHDDASAMHRLPTTEVWHHYAGAAVRLLTLHPDGRALEHRLGKDLHAGERPQIVVPGGVWQGAISEGDHSLLGTTMAPPYDHAGFELGDPEELAQHYPEAADLLGRIAQRSRHLLEDDR